MKLIRTLLEEGKISFSDDELKKLEKIIDKSNFNSDNDQGEAGGFEKLLEAIVMYKKSEKYLTSDQLLKLSRKTYNDIIDKESIDPRWSITRDSRSTIRSSTNEEQLKKIIFEKTKIEIVDDNQFILKYPNFEEEKSKTYTNFEFLVKFNNDKLYFIFEKTFKESNVELMKPQDQLYPEEIQIAMFQKLIDSNPEILERIKSTKKINCIRSKIINDQSLYRISRYLELKAKNPDDLELKKILSSTPNQSNTENFINQLKHVYGIEIYRSNSPKVTGAFGLKQTFQLR